MEKLLNTICLFGWSFVMFSTGLKLALDPKAYLTSDITTDVMILRWVQTTQIFDMLLVLLGKSKGSYLGTFCQTFARIFVVWVYVTPQSNNKLFILISIAWSIAQVNRYLYYLFNTNPATILLRYNAFIVLYPIGCYGQVCIINDYIKVRAEYITDNQVHLARFSQFCIIAGTIVLYIHLLRSRKRNMKKLNNSQRKVQQVEGGADATRDRSRSPKGKRD